MALPGDTSKQREIVFHATPPAQAERAHDVLAQLPKLTVRRLGDRQLEVRYDLADHSLEDLESRLSQQCFHLEVSLLILLKRALIYHVERVQRENLGKPQSKTKNYQPHIQVWDQRPHGDHDETPQEWRQYK